MTLGSSVKDIQKQPALDVFPFVPIVGITLPVSLADIDTLHPNRLLRYYLDLAALTSVVMLILPLPANGF